MTKIHWNKNRKKSDYFLFKSGLKHFTSHNFNFWWYFAPPQRQPAVWSQFREEIYRWTGQKESEENWGAEKPDEPSQQQGWQNGGLRLYKYIYIKSLQNFRDMSDISLNPSWTNCTSIDHFKSSLCCLHLNAFQNSNDLLQIL